MLQVVPQPPIEIGGRTYENCTHINVNGVAVPREQIEALASGKEMLIVSRTEVAEFGALCVMNRKRKLTAREALEEYLEYHPEVVERNGKPG